MRLIRITSAPGLAKPVFEHYKRHFSTAIGYPYNSSSSEEWAETDLRRVMELAAQNPPVFIEAFYDACEALRSSSQFLSVPNVEMINDLLDTYGLGLQIDGNSLSAADTGTISVPIPDIPPTIAEQARQYLMASSRRADTLLAEGHGREAVQENLWLLETIATAFRGLDTGTGTLEGNYFNQIVRELRQLHSNTTMERVLRWVNEMHGYLSSPAGGGVRHGLDLNSGIQMTLNEAQLFCNLIRSFISFFLTEHERINQQR